MIWFTWRQFRTQTWVTAALLAAAAAVLIITGLHLSDLYSTVASCHSHCGNAIAGFLQQAKAGLSGIVYNASAVLIYVTPPIIGAFWGAPLIARELETGTHRLAWNQTVTRRRWLAVKLATVGGIGLVTTGLLSLGVTWWARHIDAGAGNRITPLVFGARCLVPIGYTAFAFALGVTLGMLIRRTIPAMATTLVLYIAAVASMPLWIRAHLQPLQHSSRVLTTDSIVGLGTNDHGTTMRVFTSGKVPGGWVVSDRVVTPSGHLFTGPANPQYCGGAANLRDCLTWLTSLHLRELVAYQPASHFWPLQWIESGTFLGVTAILVGFCFWWTARKLS